MKVSVVDLRYRMNDVMKALERNEEVAILYHGKLKGVIKPQVGASGQGMADHPFFGMARDADASLEALRGGRYRDL